MMKTSLQFFVSIRIRLVREQVEETQKTVKNAANIMILLSFEHKNYSFK